MPPADIPFRKITSGGLAMHCATSGPEAGPLVILLHGLPARWSISREPMTKLAAAGLFVVAPDLRGYGESADPRGREHYSMHRLVDDVEAIILSVGREHAFIGGHDMGGGVAWCTAMFRPHRVQRLAILNSVHPIGFERAMRHWEQVKKSWYVFFFQLPRIPEWFLRRHDFALVARSLEADGLPPDVVRDLLEGIEPPGALEGALNAYRQSFRDGLAKRLVAQNVSLPVLSIWGDRETHLLAELATPPSDWVTDAHVEHVPEGSHWVHHDAPDRVSALLVRHFGETSPTT